MSIPALKAALEAYSHPRLDPEKAFYVHTYPNGFQQTITYWDAAADALDRIEALERELIQIYTDPWVKGHREGLKNG